jgi:hypothetical protein
MSLGTGWSPDPMVTVWHSPPPLTLAEEVNIKQQGGDGSGSGRDSPLSSPQWLA